MRLRFRGLFASLLVISFAMMLGSHLMTFGGALVMFGRFVVGVLGHANLVDRVATFPKRRGGVIVPISAGDWRSRMGW
jgi:hypothetical protein